MAGYIGSKASVVSSGAERKKTFTITTNTTSLTGLSYTVNQVHVFHNGVRLVDGTDYTATNGTSITLSSAAENGDEVVVISYASFQTSDTVSASAGGTFSNAVTIDADGATALTVDRATSNGTIIDFRKDNATVGSIGTLSGDLYLGTSDTGFRFSDSNNAVAPFNTSTPAGRDAAIDLGLSTTRFKDLYLSGGVYLGGTGAANKLDDYEEGTFTPNLLATSVNPSFTYTKRAGKYRKIGNTVLVNIDLRWSAHTQGSGTLYIADLPFSSGDIYSTAAVGEYSSSWSYGSYSTLTVETANSVSVYPLFAGAGLNTSGIPATALAAQSGYIIFSLMYSVD